jgi:hypothetical protein
MDASSSQYLQFPPSSTTADANRTHVETAQHRLPMHVTLPAYPARQSRRRSFNEFEEVYIFIKILFRLLTWEGSNSAPNSSSFGSPFALASGACDPRELLWRAKQIVLECTRRNRGGQLDFQPLARAVERHLRPAVGEYYWSLTLAYKGRFLQNYSLHQPTTCDSIVPV